MTVTINRVDHVTLRPSALKEPAPPASVAAALRRLLRPPDELGPAQAYVGSDLDVEGNLRAALRAVRLAVDDRGLVRRRPDA